MVRRTENNRARNGIQAQIIAGRDGRPAFALLPLDIFVTLLAYARKGNEEALDKVARGRLYNRLQEDGLASATRLFIGEWESGKTAFLRKHFKSMLSDEQMKKTFKDVSDWLLSTTAVHPAGDAGDAGDAEDVAAYDAAKAHREESFPSEIADRLIAGENPIKIFREYRGLTQRQLARAAATTAPYVSQIETGRRVGSVKLLHRLADALDVGLDDLA